MCLCVCDAQGGGVRRAWAIGPPSANGVMRRDSSSNAHLHEPQRAVTAAARVERGDRVDRVAGVRRLARLGGNRVDGDRIVAAVRHVEPVRA